MAPHLQRVDLSFLRPETPIRHGVIGPNKVNLPNDIIQSKSVDCSVLFSYSAFELQVCSNKISSVQFKTV